MKIVIEIPKEEYERIKACTSPMTWAEHLIKNSTPLPKGHGVLKDADGLLEMTKSYKSELGRLKADPFVKNGIETVEGFIKEMPAIIEADKTESE